MKDAIQQIGAVAGLASFLGLGILAFLHFAQARHVRDLEDKATFVPDDLDLAATTRTGTPTPGKAGAASEPATKKEQKAAAAAAKTPAAAAQAQLEAARQTEVARAAAERRQRFQERRGGGPLTSGSGYEEGDLSARRRMPEPRAMIVIGLGVAVLLAGVVFGAGRLLGGSNDSGTTATGANSLQGQGPPVEIAVLNGTPVPGLAAKIGELVRQAGSYKLGNVTNTESPFTATTVMFDPSDPQSKGTAQALAGSLQVKQVLPMTGEVKKASNPATVAVVVGEDRAGT